MSEVMSVCGYECLWFQRALISVVTNGRKRMDGWIYVYRNLKMIV